MTEETKETALGDGLWKNVTVLLAVRLTVVNRQVTEIESMVVRSREEGVLFQPDAFKTPNAGMAHVPTAADAYRFENGQKIGAPSGWDK